MKTWLVLLRASEDPARATMIRPPGKVGIGSKERGKNSNNCCPDCKSNLKRVKRFFKDKIIYYLTLGMFDWRRYICDKCGWEGLRWAKQYKFKG